MENGGPSRTALATARARAYHQVADRQLILTDPLAERILDTGIEEDTELSGTTTRPRRLFFAARSRFAEDRVAVAAAAGVRQVVILGAGLDTFAYRNPFPDLRVFEVDHPATQAWKRERLDAAGIDRPETVTFVPVDFETQYLARELAAAGFVRTDPVVFVWLGVVFYLTPEAASTTLEYIAAQAAPVDVVFDYLQPADNDADRARLRERSARLAATVGEPFFSYFTPADIADRLRALGFTEIEDHAGTDLVAGYLDDPGEFAGDPPQPLRAIRILRASR
ncbi:class I SAM-dependent methyltransferase [Nocardia nova]|uniref:class I SAM-dependent methyltransferase n=1 Tax=Nocardia nova TaxID=37330 RepID=UPI0034074767